MKVNQESKDYINKIDDESQREIVNKLMETILACNEYLNCEIKWRQLVFAVNDDFHHWICSINPTKKYVGLNFHFGSYLTDNTNILKAGTSKFLRQIQLTDLSQVENKVISELVKQAINKLEEFKQTWKQK